MSRSRIQRGRATQRILADYWRRVGIWPYADAIGASEAGDDIKNTPGVLVEVKATSDGPLLSALRQIKKRALKKGNNGLPLVVWRPDGYGPERVGEWVMAFTLEEGTALLRAAGYGEPEKGEVA